MPLVTRTVIVYIDDELVEVDIEIYEPVKENVCRLCEKVELIGDNEIICHECWLSVEEVEPKNEAQTQISAVEDDIISYRSFTPFRIEDAQSNSSNPFISAPERGILNEKWCKELVSRERNQSNVSEISETSEK